MEQKTIEFEDQVDEDEIDDEEDDEPDEIEHFILDESNCWRFLRQMTVENGWEGSTIDSLESSYDFHGYDTMTLDVDGDTWRMVLFSIRNRTDSDPDVESQLNEYAAQHMAENEDCYVQSWLQQETGLEIESTRHLSLSGDFQNLFEEWCKDNVGDWQEEICCGEEGHTGEVTVGDNKVYYAYWRE